MASYSLVFVGIFLVALYFRVISTVFAPGSPYLVHSGPLLGGALQDFGSPCKVKVGPKRVGKQYTLPQIVSVRRMSRKSWITERTEGAEFFSVRTLAIKKRPQSKKPMSGFRDLDFFPQKWSKYGKKKKNSPKLPGMRVGGEIFEI